VCIGLVFCTQRHIDGPSNGTRSIAHSRNRSSGVQDLARRRLPTGAGERQDETYPAIALYRVVTDDSAGGCFRASGGGEAGGEPECRGFWMSGATVQGGSAFVDWP